MNHFPVLLWARRRRRGMTGSSQSTHSSRSELSHTAWQSRPASCCSELPGSIFRGSSCEKAADLSSPSSSRCLSSFPRGRFVFGLLLLLVTVLLRCPALPRPETHTFAIITTAPIHVRPSQGCHSRNGPRKGTSLSTGTSEELNGGMQRG